jgi:hypothetical protein
MGLVYDVFQIPTWGVAPAEVSFKRNDPGAAGVAIENIKVELATIAKVPGGGAVADQIGRARDADGCRRGLDMLRGLANHWAAREQAVSALDLGYGLGSGWSHCRPDDAQPGMWQSEKREGLDALGRAMGAFSALRALIPKLDGQIGFHMQSLQSEISATNTPFDVKLFDKFVAIIGEVQRGLQGAGA